MQAPGAPSGATFSSLGLPALNASGHTAFRAFLGGVDVRMSNDVGIWSEGQGTLALIAREGDHAPDAPAGVKFHSFYDPALNAAGRTAFVAELPTTHGLRPYQDDGIWSEGSGALAQVARFGIPAPGMPGLTFSSFNAPVMNASGHTAFRGSAEDLNGKLTSGIWSEGSGALALVAGQGGPAPGTGAGVRFADVNPPVMNASGRTAFLATLQGTGMTTSNNVGIWSEGSGALALVARSGSHAPGTPAGANFDSEFSYPVINASGRTAFAAGLKTGGGGVTTSNNQGIWSEGSGALALVAREGSQAPGTPAGANFGGFGATLLNASGQLAFGGSLQHGSGGVGSSNDAGIWSTGSGELALVARSGSQAPGTPAGASFYAFVDLALNAGGRTAFAAELQIGEGGVLESNDRGVWAENAAGALTLVFREGDAFEVAPGDFRTLSNFAFPATNPVQNAAGDDEARGMAFNENFTLAFLAEFTDGTHGVFTATLVVPEPETWLIAGAAVVGAGVIGRRRR
jgi:hypothetical protein